MSDLEIMLSSRASKEKLIKIIALTSSTNDNEALVALRKAQQYLKKEAQISMHAFVEAVLEKRIGQSNGYSSKRAEERSERTTTSDGIPHELKEFSFIEILDLFDALIRIAERSGRDSLFFKSVKLQYEHKNTLSVKQWAAFLMSLQTNDLV